jgi:hypothetical protein
MSKSAELLDLNKDELAFLQTALKDQGIAVDHARTSYSEAELRNYGFIRENWSVNEVIEKGFAKKGVITSFDLGAHKARRELVVDAPFAETVQKWQLPIPLPGFRVIMTRFPRNTIVKAHVHPNINGAACGQFRVVVIGSIIYNKRKYVPGDWFFIPNDTPYTFTTDPDMETLENYYYQYAGVTGLPMRFSLLRPMTLKQRRPTRRQSP